MSKEKIVIKSHEDLRAFIGSEKFHEILVCTKKSLYGDFDFDNMTEELYFNLFVQMLCSITGSLIMNLIEATHEEFKQDMKNHIKQCIIGALIEVCNTKNKVENE